MIVAFTGFTSMAHAIPSDEEMRKAGESIKAEYAALKTPADKKKYKREMMNTLEKDLAPALPVKISDGISWTKVNVDKKKDVVRYTYQLSSSEAKELGSVSKNSEALGVFRKEFYQLFCGNAVMSSMLDLGINVQLDYVNQQNKKVIPTTTVSTQTCKS